MTPQKLDLPIWENFSWDNGRITDLRQQLRMYLKNGGDLNQIKKRIIIKRLNTPEVEEYTLYDWVMMRPISEGKKSANRHFAITAMLRCLGAKPACQLVAKMSSEEKIKNRLDSIRLLKNHLHKQEQILSNKAQSYQKD